MRKALGLGLSFVLPGALCLPVFGQQNPVRVEYGTVRVEISDEDVANLTPEGRGPLRFVTDHLISNIRSVESIRVEFPSSYFETQKPIVEPGDYLILPSVEEELEQLGGQRFTRAQMASIRKTGSFQIASLGYSNQPHVWQTSSFLIAGKKNITIWVQQDAARAIAQFRYEIGDAIFGSGTLERQAGLSVRSGLSRIVRTGLKQTINLVIGVPQNIAALNEMDIEAALEWEQTKFIFDKISALGKEREFAPDLRLILANPADDEARNFIKQVNIIVSRIESKHLDEWNQGFDARTRSIQAQVQEDVDAGRLKLEDVAQEITDRLARLQNQTFFHAIRDSQELESLGAGLAALIARNAEAPGVVRDLEYQYALARSLALKNKEAELRKSHPTFSQIPEWLNPRLDRFGAEFDERELNLFYISIFSALYAAGFVQEASILELQREFQKSRMPQLARDLRAKQVTLIELNFAVLKSWNPKKWVEKRLPSDPSGETYFLAPFKYQTVSSEKALWRWQAGVARWKQTSSAWTRMILLSNLWDGRLGLRALDPTRNEFLTSWTLDARTGEVSRDPYEVAPTVRGRLDSIWNLVSTNRQRIRDDREAGALGRAPRAVFAYLWNEIGIGLGGSTLVGIGMPTLVLANTVVSSVLAVAAATPILSVGAWATNATVFSFEDYSGRINRARWSYRRGLFENIAPPISQVGLPVVLGGLEAGFASLVRTPWHLIRGTLSTLKVGLYDQVFLRARDAVLSLLMARFGETRSQDAYDMRSASGPGIASQYYFQVNRELVLLSLRAQMEYLETERIARRARQEIEGPLNRVDFIDRSVLLLLMKNVDRVDAWPSVRGLCEQQTQQLEALQDELSEKRKFYASLLQQNRRGSVRLTEENLRYVFAAGADLSRTFFEEKMRDWNSQEVRHFWKSRNLNENDWLGLSARLLAETFSDQILASLESLDPQTVIRVDTPAWDEVVQDLVSGISPEALSRYRVETLIRRNAEEPASRVQVVSATAACDMKLLSLRSAN